MFKISTKGDYGLLILSAIAEKMRDGRQFVSLHEIAHEKRLSLSYISQIIIPLREGGLVRSKEGRDGGYQLAKDPCEITMMEVLEALEGPVEPVRCCANSEGQCGSEPYCNVKNTWQEAKMMMMRFLKTKTLEDTLKKEMTKS